MATKLCFRFGFCVCVSLPGWKEIAAAQIGAFQHLPGKYAGTNYAKNDKVQHNNVPCPHPDDPRFGVDNAQSAAHPQDEDELTPVTTAT